MTYPIGKAGVPWGPKEKAAWLARQSPRRSYEADVLLPAKPLGARFDVAQYGALDADPKRYPLIAYRTRRWRDALPAAIVTGGVHGYETSGVLGALAFLDRHAERYQDRVNLLVAPCVSPWAWEMIQRWNMHAVDPNRSFVNGAAQESASLMALLAPLRARVLVHVDLHETTDSDEHEFRPALAARDGKPFEPETIPDGFYSVDDAERPQTAFHSAAIEAVSRVTSIAEADADGEIIGSKVVARGVIEYPLKQLGLCAGYTAAPYKMTTEVYPDSPGTSPAECISAQVAAACAGIEYALRAL